MKKLYRWFNQIDTKTPASSPLTDDETAEYFSAFQKSVEQPVVKKHKKINIALAAALLLSPLALINEDVQGAAGKLLNDIRYSMTDFVSPAASTYATHINETLSIGNVDYKLTDVYADDHYLTYHLLVDLPDDADLNAVNTDLRSLKIDGHAVMTGSFGSSQVIDDKKKIISETQTIIMNRQVTDQPEKFELAFNDTQTKTAAVYQFTSDSSKLEQDTKKYALNKKVKIGQHNITIKQLMVNPLTARLLLSYPVTQDIYDITATDENGKTYSFDTNTVESKKQSNAMLSFNPDFSSGTIEDLNLAKNLKLTFEGRNGQQNGEVEVSSRNEQPIEIKLK